MDAIMSALPILAIGIGALLVLLAFRNFAARPAAGGLQVMAPNYAPGAANSTQYGTQTASGIPFYDQYQDKFAIVNTGSVPAGMTLEGAIQPAPVCVNGGAACERAIGVQQQNPAACAGVVTGNMNRADYNFDANATCPSIAGNVRTLYGCLDKSSTTWNPHANTHDQRFCQYPTVTSGCTDRGAINFNEAAMVNDGSCVTARVGCMDVMASNYDASANTPCEGCCVPNTYGCTLPTSPNYQPTATMDDGSCISPNEAQLALQESMETPMCGNMMTAPFTASNCAAPMDNPWLGNLQSCGSPWNMNDTANRNANVY